MKIFKYLMDKYINPIIVTIVTSMIFILGSKVTTGKWLEWFKLNSVTPLIFFGVSIILLFIFRRVKHLKYLDGPFVGVSYGAPYGWIPLGDIKYNKVIWRLRSPKSGLSGSDYSISRIDVKIPPRCPNCETELEESHSFWGGYIWKCVMCNFKNRNRESYYTEKKRVEKIARRTLELQDENT